MPDGDTFVHNQRQNPAVDADAYQRMVREIGEYAIFMLTRDNRVASWNKGVERIFGYSEEEFIGQPSALLFIPEDRERGEPAKEAEIAADTGQAADDRWHLRKDGSRFWVNGIMTALHNQQGELDGFVKVMRDNSDSQQREEALRDSEEPCASPLQSLICMSGKSI